MGGGLAGDTLAGDTTPVGDTLVGDTLVNELFWRNHLYDGVQCGKVKLRVM